MSRKILLVHHFELTCVTGVRAFLSELLRIIPERRPGTAAAFEPYQRHRDAASFVASIAGRHGDTDVVVAVNGHIDLRREYTVGLLEWATQERRRTFLYVHDYWPQHGPLLASLRQRHGVGLLASTHVVRDAMSADGLASVLVPVGIPTQNIETTMAGVAGDTGRKVVGSIGRLVPRKRFPDVVTAFGSSRIGDRAALHLRLLTSGVRSPLADARVLETIEAAQRAAALDGAVRIDRAPTERADYRDYHLYVCASSYEGFSMTPIEAAYSGCAPLMSDIPAHRAIASTLFEDQAGRHLYPAGDTDALGRLIRAEIETGERGAEVRARLRVIRARVHATWSPLQSADALLAAVD